MSRDTEARASSPERHAQALRLELKQWEKSFAEANGGRKAERSDIKKDPTIGKCSSRSLPMFQATNSCSQLRSTRSTTGYEPAAPRTIPSARRRQRHPTMPLRNASGTVSRTPDRPPLSHTARSPNRLRAQSLNAPPQLRPHTRTPSIHMMPLTQFTPPRQPSAPQLDPRRSVTAIPSDFSIFFHPASRPCPRRRLPTPLLRAQLAPPTSKPRSATGRAP